LPVISFVSRWVSLSLAQVAVWPAAWALRIEYAGELERIGRVWD